MASWGYAPDNGPEKWAHMFPQAGGQQQSPVDIITQQTVGDSQLESVKLTFSYTEQSNLQMINTGQGWKVQAPQPDSCLEGGPLGGDVYKLEQFHCHWGPTCEEGSEHTVDGRAFAGELHLVHWNTTKYSSFAEAAQHSDGLAVLGVFLQAGDEEHEEVEKIASQLSQVRYSGQTTCLLQAVNPARLLPESLGYWTYEGSLTTPPCNECVTWLVFKQPIIVTEKQLDEFRGLSCSCEPAEEKLVLKNYRPPQPLGARCLRECNAA